MELRNPTQAWYVKPQHCTVEEIGASSKGILNCIHKERSNQEKICMYVPIYTNMNTHTHKLVYIRTHSDAKNLKQAPDPLGRLPEGSTPSLGHY